MKKFLSVLLALAVAFTFTFGSCMSAFATVTTTETTASIVDTDTYNYQQVVALINAQAKDLNAQVENTEKEALKNALTTALTADGITISYEATKVVFDAMVKEANETTTPANVEKAMVKLNTAFAGQAADYAVAGTAVKTIMADLEVPYADAAAMAADADDVKLLAAQLDVEIATANKVIAKVNLDDYSTTVPEVSPYKSNYTLVKELVDAAKKTLADNAFDKTTDTSTTAVKAKISNVQGAVDSTFTDAVAAIATKTQEGYTAADLDAIKTDAITKVTAAINSAKADYVAGQNATITANNRILADSSKTALEKAAAQTAIDTAKENIANADISYAALIAEYTANINAATTAGALTTVYNQKTGAYTLKTVYTNPTVDADALAIAVAKKNQAAALEEQAKDAKAYIGIEGSNYNNAEAVDAELKAKLAQMYADNCLTLGTYATVAEYLAGTYKIAGKTDAELLVAFIESLVGDALHATVDLDKTVYATVYAWNANADSTYDYDEEQVKAVKAIAKDAKEAIEAAKTVADAKAAFLAAYEKYDAIPTTAEHNKLYEKGGALYEAYTGYVAQLTATAASKEALINAADYDYVKATMLTNMSNKMKLANTSEDLTATYNDMKATIDGLKTAKEIKAEYDALNARVMAIKTPVTADAKAEIVAISDAYTALDAYCTLIGAAGPYAKYNTLNDTYYAAVGTLEAKALDDAYKAIGTVELADKDAIKALRDAYDAWDEEFAGVTGVTGPTYATDANIEKMEEAVSKLVVANVKTLIQQLATDGSNPDAVKAARDAYDALTAAEKADAGIVALYDKLVVAEKAVAAKEEANKYTDTDAKAYILDMKVTAKASKVSKTKAKMAVTVNVTELKDNGYTVKYKYYVKAPGKKSYKLKKTSTKKSYTFTKLAKGKNTFKVKVMVYNADGKLVGSKTKTKTYTRK